MGAYVDIDKLFTRRADGSIEKRKPGAWSSTASACIDCGRTDRKHEAFGRCRLCYMKHKRATDPEWRRRKNFLKKQCDIKNWERVRERDRERLRDPKRIAVHKAAAMRWQEKNRAKWPRGSAVFYELIPGTWIKGTIIDKSNTSALVKFATYEERISFKFLSKQAGISLKEVA